MGGIEWTFQLRLAVALALGFLVGLERESTKIEQQKLVFGGVRTHPLISLLGFGCAWLHQIGVTFMLPVGLLVMGGLTAIAYQAKIRTERFGSTSEISALLTFVTGSLALLVDVWIAMALGIFNAILLSEKARLETYVENLNKVEFLAALKFLLATLIILPVLPDQYYTRFRINPSHVWEIVILVSTVGFVGYYLAKKFGQRVGLWLAGLLGGIVSSTAVTIAVGRMARKQPGRALSALQASILSGSIMYIRMLVLIGLVNGAFLPGLWWKLLVLAVIGLGLAVRMPRSDAAEEEEEMPVLQNPFEITPALMFAMLFVLLGVATELVRESIGNAGLLGFAALVGVSDITPFVLSLVRVSEPVSQIAGAAIIISMMGNVIARGAYFWSLSVDTRKTTAWRYGVWALLHIPLVFVA